MTCPYTHGQLLDAMDERNASDLYLTVGAPPCARVGDSITALGKEPLREADVRGLVAAMLGEEVLSEFESTLEFNTSFAWKEHARFRINLFRQRQQTGAVLRRIHTKIPALESLHLPAIYGEVIMEKRGLVLVVGPTGSGKSTSLAAMLEHRNQHGSGHIVTIEDPIEYVLEHKGCIITQRDLGIDTYSFGIALKNALRQCPDIIVIGEIRDRETMEHAINFAETGHLCIATLHANNANQAIERIINFFPEEKHAQVLLNLSLNLRAVLSQRLLPALTGDPYIVALEILLNQGLIRSLIHDGKIKEIKDVIEKSRDLGMQSFDQSLYDLCVRHVITEETALHEADNPTNLRLLLKQRSFAGHHPNHHQTPTPVTPRPASNF